MFYGYPFSVTLLDQSVSHALCARRSPMGGGTTTQFLVQVTFSSFDNLLSRRLSFPGRAQNPNQVLILVNVGVYLVRLWAWTPCHWRTEPNRIELPFLLQRISYQTSEYVAYLVIRPDADADADAPPPFQAKLHYMANHFQVQVQTPISIPTLITFSLSRSIPAPLPHQQSQHSPHPPF